MDTAAGHWKDRGDGKGIVPDDTSHRPKQPEHRRSFESIAPSLSSEESVAATHYAGGPVKGKYAWTRALRRYFTTRGIVDRLLRKTIRANTWIYVTDKNCKSWDFCRNASSDCILQSICSLESRTPEIVRAVRDSIMPVVILT